VTAGRLARVKKNIEFFENKKNQKISKINNSPQNGRSRVK
jgi:hypothetical protein